MGKAGAQIEITASSSRLAAGLSQAYSKFQTWGGAVARGINGAFKKINAKLEPGQTMKNAVGHLGGDLLGRGLSAITDAAGDVRDFNRDIQRMGISAGKTPAQINEVGKSLRKASVDFGVNSNELAKASGLYFDLTSDSEGMTTAMSTLAKVSQASGADMESLVRTAAAMGDNMGIGADQMEAAFSGLIQQGKAGKVTLAELAREAPGLMAMWSSFGRGTGTQGLMEMNAALQVGAKAFGTASQAATGLEAMLGMLKARQAQLAAVGVQVYQKNKDGTVSLRNLHDIVDQIQKKKIDPRKYGKIFGENKEGRNFLEMLMKQRDLYGQVLEAGKDAGAVQRDSMAYAESDAGRLDLALNKIKETIASAFTPERITGFVNAIEGLVDKLGGVVELAGKAGDLLGGIAGVGKSIRGWMNGNANNNPWRDTEFQDAMQSGDLAETAGMLRPGESDAQRNARLTGLRLRNANRGAYDSTVEGIMGSEVNERTSKESIRRAYFASTSDMTKDGGAGAREAGERYLKAAGVTKDQAADAYGKEVLAEMKQLNAAMQVVATNLALKQAITQIGDNAVAKAQASATAPRRKAH